MFKSKLSLKTSISYLQRPIRLLFMDRSMCETSWFNLWLKSSKTKVLSEIYYNQRTNVRMSYLLLYSIALTTVSHSSFKTSLTDKAVGWRYFNWLSYLDRKRNWLYINWLYKCNILNMFGEDFVYECGWILSYTTIMLRGMLGQCVWLVIDEFETPKGSRSYLRTKKLYLHCLVLGCFYTTHIHCLFEG